jgi:hypothetical protein
MAKKVVATLKDKTKAVSLTKVIRAVKNEKSGAYSFKEDIVPTDSVSDLIAGKYER